MCVLHQGQFVRASGFVVLLVFITVLCLIVVDLDAGRILLRRRRFS